MPVDPIGSSTFAENEYGCQLNTLSTFGPSFDKNAAQRLLVHGSFPDCLDTGSFSLSLLENVQSEEGEEPGQEWLQTLQELALQWLELYPLCPSTITEIKEVTKYNQPELYELGNSASSCSIMT